MEHNVEINGVSIFYEQQGGGRPVILLQDVYKRQISDIYYLRESPATFPVCGGFVFFHREYMSESVCCH